VGGDNSVPSISATSGLRLVPRRRFTVELFDGDNLAASGWPSIEAGPELLMYVYQSREFLEVWMASIGKARRARGFLVVVRNSANDPVLYLPLVIETKFNNRILRFMDGGVADFNAPILAAGQELTRGEFMTIWSDLLSQLPAIDLIDLKKIAGDVCGARNPLTYLDCRTYESSGHAIALSARKTDAAVDPSLCRMRKKLLRQHQRLSTLGPTQFVVNPPAARLPAFIDRLMALKRQQYLRTSGRDFFATPGIHEFYSRMLEPAQLGRISDLSALVCGDSVVSAHLGFKGRGRFYYVLPAFDTRYRSLAVGILLLDHLIERCSQEQYATFDLGEGDFSYKTKWATHRLPLMACEQAVTSIGALFGQLRRVRRINGIEQLYGLCANGRASLTGAWQTSSERGRKSGEPLSPTRQMREGT
jgi:CelD/BcsL family acetyltransferase involved in cellulose biosynthesis